ncbi:MAG TPA: XrtA system polysaccharide deacetylase [Longimicrobiales bacterium]|nr:XrtA system polysaccharide deacetylase [Longimicrobiales bacterium]
MITHHFTVDVEEYFHPTALERRIPRPAWDTLARRSPGLVRRILDWLAEDGVRGTVFVLGWLAEREPELVRDIAARGHEVASHGWDHRRVTDLSPEEFRGDVRRARAALEDLAGTRVEGYRAPSFSIQPGMEWAYDTLLEEGYRYDSSVFPVRVHPSYGHPRAPRDPHLIRRPGGVLAEIPLATLRVGVLNLPAAGGAYLRFFPVGLAHGALSDAARRGQSGTLYTHPWEFDRELPRFDAPWLTQLRMRGGIRHTLRRVRSLMRRHAFRPVRETVADLLARAGQTA